MTYQEPIVEVVCAMRHDGTANLCLKITRRGSSTFSPPLAPAGLYDRRFPAREVFQLHKAVAVEGDQLCYETYDNGTPLPVVGQQYMLRFWWTPDQLEAVTDLSAEWVRRTYPDNGDHEHCLLTWEQISAHSDHPNGYYAPTHGWITAQAYETYIVHDRLRLRRQHAM